MPESLAIILAIGAAVMWSISGHVDKYLVKNSSRDAEKNIRGLLVFSSFVIGLIAFPICLALANFDISMSWQNILISIAAGMVYITSTSLYLKAMKKNDATMVVTMFQLIPVFLYVPSVLFYGETFTLRQVIGAVIILAASIRIGISPQKSKKEGKYKAMLLALAGVICISVYYMMMDYVIRQERYFSCLAWYQVGLIITGIIMLCMKSPRKAVKSLVKRNGKTFIGLNLLNESFNEVGVVFEHIANSVLPIALVNIISGLQGAITFIIGIIGTKLSPKHFSEKIDRRTFAVKTICILFSIVGLVLIFV